MADSKRTTSGGENPRTAAAAASTPGGRFRSRLALDALIDGRHANSARDSRPPRIDGGVTIRVFGRRRPASRWWSIGTAPSVMTHEHRVAAWSLLGDERWDTG